MSTSINFALADHIVQPGIFVKEASSAKNFLRENHKSVFSLSVYSLPMYKEGVYEADKMLQASASFGTNFVKIYRILNSYGPTRP